MTRLKHSPVPLITFLTVLLFVLSPPGLALAEPPPHEGAEGHAEGEESQRMKERVRMMRMYALTEALELDEATAAKLFPYLRSGDETIHQLHDERRTHRRALHRMMKSEEVNAKALDKHIEALERLEIELARAKAEQIRGLKPILSPEQRLRFVVVQERFERRMRGMLREEQRRRRSAGREGSDGDHPPRRQPPHDR